MKRIPNRTLLLMILALIAFVRMWCATHPSGRPAPTSGSSPIPVELAPSGKPGDR